MWVGSSLWLYNIIKPVYSGQIIGPSGRFYITDGLKLVKTG